MDGSADIEANMPRGSTQLEEPVATAARMPTAGTDGGTSDGIPVVFKVRLCSVQHRCGCVDASSVYKWTGCPVQPSFCHQRVCSVPSRPPSKVAETCDARKRTVHVIHSALFCVSYGALLAMGCLWTYSSLRWLEQLFILLAQNSVAVSSMHKRCHLPHLNSPQTDFCKLRLATDSAAVHSCSLQVSRGVTEPACPSLSQASSQRSHSPANRMPCLNHQKDPSGALCLTGSDA